MYRCRCRTRRYGGLAVLIICASLLTLVSNHEPIFKQYILQQSYIQGNTQSRDRTCLMCRKKKFLMADKISIALLYNDYLIWFYKGYSLLCKMQIADSNARWLLSVVMQILSERSTDFLTPLQKKLLLQKKPLLHSPFAQSFNYKCVIFLLFP